MSLAPLDIPTQGSDSCPSEEDVACFVEGGASSSASEHILRHMDDCGACRVLLATMMRTSDRIPIERAAAGIPRTFAIGEIVNDRYRIDRFIAQGGMGEVYEAWDLQLNETIALKTVACTGLDNVKLYTRIRAEVQLARRVTHPNVCRILEFGIHCQDYRDRVEMIPFFTMEFLTGETLAQHVQRRTRLSEREILPLLSQILSGLAAIHAAGIIHRDLKPENVFLMTLATGELRVVVMDFGLARLLDTHGQIVSSHDGTAVGTPAYMAPEQALGAAPSTTWDIYALGVILYKLVSGELPFTGNTTTALAMARLRDCAPRLSSTLPGIEPSFEAMVSRCLQRDPKNRFANVQDMERAVAEFNWRAESRHATARRRYLLPIFAVACASLGAHYVVKSCARLHGSNSSAEVWSPSRPPLELAESNAQSLAAPMAALNTRPVTVAAPTNPAPSSRAATTSNVNSARTSKPSRQPSPVASKPIVSRPGLASTSVPAVPEDEEVAVPSFARSPGSWSGNP